MNEKKLEEKLTLLDRLQSSCTNCGLCSEACATFQASGWEHESPRGRLHLAGQLLHGRIDPHSHTLSTFDRCLGCQACESLCPHHVPYRQVRQLVQDIRRELTPSPPSSIEQLHYKKWIKLAYRIGNNLWRQYGGKWMTIPSLNCESYRNLVSYTKKCQRPLVEQQQPVLAVCCLQDLFQHDVIEQTLTFMQRLGHPLAVDKKQPCCGAIFERLIHGGKEAIHYPKEHEKAVVLQNRTLNSFLKWIPSQTYFLAKGCECFINKNTSKTSDLYALIEKILDQNQWTLYFSKLQTIYYQPYCNTDLNQKDSIWRLLQRVEGLKVRYVSNPLACCGGYCGETLLHPEEAQELARQKILNFPENSTVIITSPDCFALFKKFQADKNLTILYPIQILAKAWLRS